MRKSKRDGTAADDPVQSDPAAEHGAGPDAPATTEAAADGDESPESLRSQRDEYLAAWQRAQADYRNLRRRAEADLEAGLKRSMQPLLENLLLVLDHLDMALSAPTGSEESRNFAVGVQLTRDQLVRALEQEEVVAVRETGLFDPEIHQAVAMVETDEAEPGQIVECIRRGFTWRGQVLRYGQVRVAAGAGSAGGARGGAGGPEATTHGESAAAEDEAAG